MNSIERAAGIALLTIASLGILVTAEGPAEVVVRHIGVVDGADAAATPPCCPHGGASFGP